MYSLFKIFGLTFILTFFFILLLFLFQTNLAISNISLLKIACLFFFVVVCVFCVYFLNLRSLFFINQSKKEVEIQTLKTLEKYRREFFGNVSHELKTPIFNIQGYVETLIDGALYDKTVNKKYLKRTSKSIDRLIYIIKDLESISQLESEELNLEISDWKLKTLIAEVLEQFEIKAKKKKIKLLHDKKSTNVMVRGDKDKISQVLSNLISNSIKYGKHGGFTKLGLHQTSEKSMVFIKDNGIGIAEKNINRLFERFYRVDKSRSREQGGTGLGLAIVKHIIEAHDQVVNVKSKVGKGTEFSFSIECLKK